MESEKHLYPYHLKLTDGSQTIGPHIATVEFSDRRFELQFVSEGKTLIVHLTASELDFLARASRDLIGTKRVC